MQINKKLRNTSTISLLIGALGLLLILYFPIVFKYFEQDEWRDYGWHIYYSHLFSFPQYLLYILKTSSIPVTSFFNALNYHLFGINNWFSAITVLTLMCVNVFLWSRIIYKLTKSNFVAVGSALLGYTNYISSQAMTWVMPAVASQFSFLFITVALYLFFLYLEKRGKKILVYIVIACILSIFSKLNSFFIVLLLPITFLIFDKKFTLKKKLSASFGFGVVLFLLAFGLFFLKFGFVHLGTTRYVKSLSDILFNAIFLPLKSVSQIILFNPAIIYDAVSLILQKRYHFGPYPLFEQTILTELFSIIVSIFFIMLFAVFFVAAKKWRKVLLFLGTFYILSFTPFMLDTFSTGNGFMESRYYQISVFPLAAAALLMLFFLWNTLKGRVGKKIRPGISILGIGLLLLYIGWNCVLIRQKLDTSIVVTNRRRELLTFFQTETKPAERRKVILYIADRNYPGRTGNITGFLFQTGIFYPYLVSNFAQGKIPYSIFARDDIWSYDYQGVVSIDDTRYGIFYSPELLKSYLSSHPEDKDAVYVFDFDYRKLQHNPAFTGGVNDLLLVDVARKSLKDIYEK